MKDDFNKVLEQTAEIFLSAGYTHIEFADVMLSLILRNYLCDHFDIEAKTEDDSCDWLTLTKDTNYKSGNRHLKSYEYDLFNSWIKINADHFKNISSNRWSSIHHLWHGFFSGNQQNRFWQKETVDHIFNSIESFLAKHYQRSHEYFTPRDVANLIVDLVDKFSDASNVYDPNCRSGDLLHLAGKRLPGIKKIIGRSHENITWRIAKMNLLMSGTSFEADIYKSIRDDFEDHGEKFDIILTNPPFKSLPSDFSMQSSKGEWINRFSKIKRYEVLFLCHILDHLSDRGRAAIIVPTSILSGQGSLKELRNQIVDRNLLDAVITLPPRIFYKTGTSAAILIFDKSRRTKSVLMIDASGMGIKERDRVKLQDFETNELAAVFNDYKENKLEETSRSYKNPGLIVEYEKIKLRKYDLQYSTYLDKETSLHQQLEVKSEELWNEFMQIQNELSKVQGEIQAFMKK